VGAPWSISRASRKGDPKGRPYDPRRAHAVIARSEATKQSRSGLAAWIFASLATTAIVVAKLISERKDRYPTVLQFTGRSP
jgi:hypothetical protein